MKRILPTILLASALLLSTATYSLADGWDRDGRVFHDHSNERFYDNRDRQWHPYGEPGYNYDRQPYGAPGIQLQLPGFGVQVR